MYGLELSKLDGSEKTYKYKALSLPATQTYARWLNVKDQGATSQCVPYSLSQVVELYYRMNNEKNPKMDIIELYRGRQDPKKNGMSFKEALLRMKKEGFFTSGSLRHIYDFCLLPSQQVMREFLVANLPFVIGVPVADVQQTAFWRGAPRQGYHALTVTGYDDTGFEVLNSWGLTYGDNGFAHFPYEDCRFIKEAWGLLF